MMKENLKKSRKTGKRDRIGDPRFGKFNMYDEGCEIMDELLKQIRMSAPSLVCVCIDRTEDENMEGRLYHKYKKDAVYFHSVSSLLNEMERLYDRIGFPQAATRQRTFSDLNGKTKRQEEAIQVADTKDLAFEKSKYFSKYSVHLIEIRNNFSTKKEHIVVLNKQ